MAFNDVGNRVRIADDSSQWRGHSGLVVSQDTIDDTLYNNVRIDGHGAHSHQPFLTAQLKTEPLASPVDYSHAK